MQGDCGAPPNPRHPDSVALDSENEAKEHMKARPDWGYQHGPT